MDSAVFWIEYVARHQGRINMKPSAVNVNAFQYLLLDVLFIFILAMMITFFAVNKVLKLIFIFIKTGSNTKQKKKNPSKKNN